MTLIGENVLGSHLVPKGLVPLLLLVVLTMSSAFEARAYEGPLQNTVTAILSAYGGRERLLAVKAVAAHGRIDDFLRKVSGGYARTMARPGQLRIDIMPERGGEVRILDNGKGLQGSGQNLRAANSLSLSSMRYQYGYLDLPMSLADNTAKATHQGIRELHGRPMEVVRVALDEAPDLTVYVDFETHLIRRVEAIFDMNGMGSSQLGTEYDDFRTVDGVVFPFRLANFAGGNNISVILIVRLTINQPPPGNAFPFSPIRK